MINYNNAKINLITLLRGLFLGTAGGTRTHMVSRWILNPVRLPIPPQRHKFLAKHSIVILLSLVLLSQ